VKLSKRPGPKVFIAELWPMFFSRSLPSMHRLCFGKMVAICLLLHQCPANRAVIRFSFLEYITLSKRCKELRWFSYKECGTKIRKISKQTDI
jgi:hypothetical protein